MTAILEFLAAAPDPPSRIVTLAMLAACLCLVVVAARLRLANRALRREQQAVASAETARRDILGNVSHELRAPLASICGIADLLRAEPELDPVDRDGFVRTIQEQSRRLVRLIDDLIAGSQLNAAAFPMRFQVLRAQDTVLSCVAALRNPAATRRVAIKTELDAELPAIWADPDRCAQVVVNLLDNALKHAPAGSVVEVGARRSGVRRTRLQPAAAPAHGIPAGLESDAAPAAEYLVITVTDQGPGIPAADQQRVFERFVQLGAPANGKPSGLGLGLAIAADIAVQHGGALWVESDPGTGRGAGTTFAASFPAAATPAVHPAALAALHS